MNALTQGEREAMSREQTELAADYKAFIEHPFMAAVRVFAEETARGIRNRLELEIKGGKVDPLRASLAGLELKIAEEILNGDYFNGAYLRLDSQIRALAQARANARSLHDKAVSPRSGDYGET